MARNIDPQHPIRSYFSEALHRSLHQQLGLPETEDVDAYIVDMMVKFMAWDGLFSVRDAAGHPVQTVSGMILEGDLRANAASFAREREVHRHIGDYLLFWSGLFPEFLKQIKHPESPDFAIDVTEQARYSYHIVSTFDYPPYDQEAPVFRRLSTEFEAYQEGLRGVRAAFEGLGPWATGFSA